MQRVKIREVVYSYGKVFAIIHQIDYFTPSKIPISKNEQFIYLN